MITGPEYAIGYSCFIKDNQTCESGSSIPMYIADTKLEALNRFDTAVNETAKDLKEGNIDVDLIRVTLFYCPYGTEYGKYEIIKTACITKDNVKIKSNKNKRNGEY